MNDIERDLRELLTAEQLRAIEAEAKVESLQRALDEAQRELDRCPSDTRGAVDRAEKAERERDEAINALGALADEFSEMPIATDLSILGGR